MVRCVWQELPTATSKTCNRAFPQLVQIDAPLVAGISFPPDGAILYNVSNFPRSRRDPFCQEFLYATHPRARLLGLLPGATVPGRILRAKSRGGEDRQTR